MALVIPGQTWERARQRAPQNPNDSKDRCAVFSMRHLYKGRKNRGKKTNSSSSKYLDILGLIIHPNSCPAYGQCMPVSPFVIRQTGKNWSAQRPMGRGSRKRSASRPLLPEIFWNLCERLDLWNSLDLLNKLDMSQHVSTSGAGRCRAQLSGLVQTIPVRQTLVSRESWDWFAKAICVEWVMSNASNAILQRNSMEIILTQMFSHLQYPCIKHTKHYFVSQQSQDAESCSTDWGGME